MIILYEDNELRFDNLGIGVLSDATSCFIKESLNDAFELEMEYPITGQFYKDIVIGRIILAKPNPFSDSQPFRISQISKPINGIITINAYHISYDMNGIIIGPVSANSIEGVINELETKTILSHSFKFKTDIQSLTSFKTTNYYNMRSLLFGSDESILETYKLEIKFDKFEVYLLSKRGSNKGAQIRYGKNMTDLTHEISYDRLYNGVYPYYHKESSQQTVTTTSNEFTKVYIVGDKPLQDGWLSFKESGDPYHPIDASPVQVATQGEYYDKVFSWDDTKQRYVEKLYDQMTTLIENAVTPDWLYVDWHEIPNIVVKANKPGYFKMMTDTEYTHKDVGDIVFKGSIRSVLTSLIVYYSEVIPGTSSNLEDVEDSVSHTDLSTDDKIVWVDTDLAKSMKYNRILQLDVTSDFKDDEEVNDENLIKKAKEYIEKNKIGQYKYTTEVSFVDLSSMNEDTKFTDLDKVELGDTVRVIHDRLEVDVELRVIETNYNAIENRYESIKLGEKEETISSSSVQTGDSISSLSNDSGYTTQQEVVNIIAKNITADYLKAVNANLSKAQIEELSTARIRCTGILEASQLDIDKLVAKLLVADNAEIKNVLTAGEIKVSGDIEVKSGEINIQNEDGTKVFHVDREGNLTANSAKIIGTIEASSGHIGGFTIGEESISSNFQSMSDSSEKGVYIGPDGISLGKQLKIFPDGTIVSTVIDLSMDPESSTQRRLTRSIEQANRAADADFGYVSLGSMSPTDINADNFTNIKANHVVNITTDGSLNNQNPNSDPTEVKKGDNVIVMVDDDDYLEYIVLSTELFIQSYRYKGFISTVELNEKRLNGELQFGDIYKIDNNDVDIYDDDHQSTILDVDVGDYVIYHHQLGYQTDQDWQFSKFIYKETSTDTFFGLTQDGILYANGAFISGDITVKSGEISIISEDGTKVFNVTREGDLTANSAKIGPLYVDSEHLYYSDNFRLYPTQYNPDGSINTNSTTMTVKSARVDLLDLGTHYFSSGGWSPNPTYTYGRFSREYGLYNISSYTTGSGTHIVRHYCYDGRIRTEDIRNILYLSMSDVVRDTDPALGGRLFNVPDAQSIDNSYLNNATNPTLIVLKHTFTAGETYTFTQSTDAPLKRIHHILMVIPYTRTTSFFTPNVPPNFSKNARTAVYWNDYNSIEAKSLDAGDVYFLVLGF